MEILFKGLLKGFELLYSFDGEIYFIIYVSLKVALGGVFFAALFGIPLGLVLALGRFRGRKTLVVITNTFVGVPTVVVGLFFFCLLSGEIGVLSPLQLLYTRWGMVIALGALGMPLMASLTNTAVRAVDPGVRKAALTLGATRVGASWMLLKEARYGIVGAVIVTFGRLISEVGIATMIGGNIRGVTRTMTTYIALETEKGDFQYAFALGVALLLIVLVFNLILSFIQRKGDR